MIPGQGARILHAAAAKSLQSCLTLYDPTDSSPPGSPIPGVGCHFLFQCVKVKSESEVAQSCPTVLNPMDYSLQFMGFSRQEYWSGVPSPFLMKMYNVFFLVPVIFFSHPHNTQLFCSLYRSDLCGEIRFAHIQT